MRKLFAWIVAFSCCAYLGCGGGSGIRNATQADLGKASGNLPGDTVDSPPPSRPAGQPGASSTAAAPTSRPARPSAASNVASEGDDFDTPSTQSPSNPSANPKPAQAAPSNVAAEGPVETNNLPAAPSAAAGVAGGKGAANPSPAQSSASNVASEGPVETNNPPAAPSAAAGVAGGKGAANPAQSSASNVAADEGPVGDTPAAPSAAGGSGVAGGKGGGGIAGGKGAAARGEPSTATVVEAGPLSLVDQAAKSFDEFKEFDATQRLYAHWLTDAEAMGEFPLQWVAGISEPRLFFRWGVGVVYNAPTDFSDQPPLIGDPVAATSSSPQRGGRSGRGGAGLNESAPTNAASSSPYAGVDQSTPTGNLLYYTGDFGERLIKRLDSRRMHKDFFYGRMLANSKFKSPEIARPRTTTTTLTTPGTQTRRATVGISEDESSRTVTTNLPGNARNTSGVVATTGTLVPGVIFLGTESETDAEKVLLERGKTSGVDAVLIFYVTVKEKSRSDSAYSTTRLGVHNLKTGESKETGSLSSQTVAKARQREKDSDNDPVEVALDKIFNEYSDAKLRVSTMPTIKPEIAQTRADTLAGESHTNPLPAVAEILSYHKAGLLSEEAAVAAVGKLIGGDEAALKLLSGTPEEKLAVVEKWLPGDSENPGQSSGEKFR